MSFLFFKIKEENNLSATKQLIKARKILLFLLKVAYLNMIGMGSKK
ncbi:hypothetical protein CAT7_02909 [Carnobacterium sp. AT7]|nr:hypothetical protein CAT7_02909 [Carnobacterium sp. AT7]